MARKDVVMRSVAFNSGTGKYAAKSIKGKTYLFDGTDGHMVTGIVDLRDKEVVDAYKDGTLFADQQVRNDVKKGIYYFNAPSDAKASTAGQMMTGKISTTDDDGNVLNYYFSKRVVPAKTITKKDVIYKFEGVSIGQAYRNAIVDNVLYDEDGVRVEATDGNTYMLYSQDSDIYYIRGNVVEDVIPAGTRIAVSNSGRVKTYGSVKIDDTYFNIGDNFEAVKDTTR